MKETALTREDLDRHEGELKMKNTPNRNGWLVLSALALVAALLAGPAMAEEESLWFHVKVVDGDDTRVTVNLPLNLVEAALPMIPVGHVHGHHFGDQDWEITTEQMRDLWQELKASPDMTFVTVEDGDERVRVWKESGYLKVQVRDDGDSETVDVTIPEQVVDALLSSEGEELNVRAAMSALVAEGEGELVTVKGDDEQVRVWVDGLPEAR